MFPKLFFLSAFAFIFIQSKKQFKNFSVFRVKPTTEEALKYLNDLQRTGNESYNFWSDIGDLNQDVDIMIAPQTANDFLSNFEKFNGKSKVLIENVQEVINRQNFGRMRLSDVNRTLDWNDYYRYDEVNNWLESLGKTYAKQVTVLRIGKSYEGRDIVGVRVHFNNARIKQDEKPSIFLEGGIHAREWISVATVTYQLNEILTTNEERKRNIIEQYDWYIFPILNPDGYEYTFTQNRMWRKTRKPNGPLGVCKGSDPNRNWDYNWHKDDLNYVYPCSDRYSGSSPFSEPETLAMSNFLKTIGHKLHAYIGYHAYSQLMLIPYGDSNEHRDNYDELMRIGQIVTNKIKIKYGTDYKVGNIVDLLYVAGGNSMDWVKNKFKTRITYVFELRDKGDYGFLLPVEQIVPVGEEMMDALINILAEFAKT